MKTSHATRTATKSANRTTGKRSRTLALSILLASALLAGSVPAASADEYDPKTAGHPLRMIGYALHPVGVVIDYLVLRPAHWLVSHEPFQTLFGHED